MGDQGTTLAMGQPSRKRKFGDIRYTSLENSLSSFATRELDQKVENGCVVGLGPLPTGTTIALIEKGLKAYKILRIYTVDDSAGDWSKGGNFASVICETAEMAEDIITAFFIDGLSIRLQGRDICPVFRWKHEHTNNLFGGEIRTYKKADLGIQDVAPNLKREREHANAGPSTDNPPATETPIDAQATAAVDKSIAMIDAPPLTGPPARDVSLGNIVRANNIAKEISDEVHCGNRKHGQQIRFLNKKLREAYAELEMLTGVVNRMKDEGDAAKKQVRDILAVLEGRLASEA